MIQVIKENEFTVLILFPYNPDFVAQVKTIAGRQ